MGNVRKRILLVGIVVIIFLLFIFLLPIISAQECKRKGISATNLKVIGMAIRAYAEDNDDLLPPLYYQKKYWFEFLEPYFNEMSSDLTKSKITICPSNKNHIWKGTNYIYNGHYENRKISDFKHPEDSFLIMDGKPDISPFFTKNNYKFCIDFRHGCHKDGSCLNVLFVDGSITHIGAKSTFKDNQLYGYLRS
ncbi:MAG: hypothetical protein ACK4F0_01320 [Candidatus Ratteibacteria bacterium]